MALFEKKDFGTPLYFHLKVDIICGFEKGDFTLDFTSLDWLFVTVRTTKSSNEIQSWKVFEDWLYK